MDRTIRRFLELVESHSMWMGINSFTRNLIVGQVWKHIPTTYARIDALAQLWQRAKEETE